MNMKSFEIIFAGRKQKLIKMTKVRLSHFRTATTEFLLLSFGCNAKGQKIRIITQEKGELR